MRRPPPKNPRIIHPNGDRIIEAFAFQDITIKADYKIILTVKKSATYGKGKKIVEKQYSGQDIIEATSYLDTERKALYKNYLVVEFTPEEVSSFRAGEYEYDWVIIDEAGNKFTPAEPGEIIIKKVVHDV